MFGNNRDEDGVFGNYRGEYRENEEISEEAKEEQIATVIRTFVEMKMEGKRPRGRHKLRSHGQEINQTW